MSSGRKSPQGGRSPKPRQERSRQDRSPRPRKQHPPNDDDTHSKRSSRRRSKDSHGDTERRQKRQKSPQGAPRKKSRSKSPRPADNGQHPAQQRHLKKVKSAARLNKGKLAEQYIIKEKLGKGNFAVVRRIVRRADSHPFAAKIISKKHLSEEEKQEIHDETSLLTRLRHPHIVRIIEVIDTPRHLYIVLELLTGGELFDRIITQGHMSEMAAAKVTQQIASALEYLHRNKIVHRDLKPENLIFSSHDADAFVKVTDFGLAKFFGDDHNPDFKRQLETTCGTPGYVAPEILKQGGYDETVDMWSTGVILYIMLCGFPPFAGGDNMKAMYRKIKRGDYSFPSPAWDTISDMAKDCVRSLLTVDPKARMSGAELLEHPWVKQADFQSSNNIANQAFTHSLKVYMHRKRLRRGVELIISLNRMIRAAGLEDTARVQRSQFRERLRAYRIRIKKEQTDLKSAIMSNDQEALDDMGHLIVYPYDDTPPIDYSKV